jgi:hypothetical protein
MSPCTRWLIFQNGILPDPPWVIQHILDRQIAEHKATQDRLKERMLAGKARERDLLKESRRQKGHISKRAKLDQPGNDSSSVRNADDEFLPVDRQDSGGLHHIPAEDGISAEVRELMNQYV